MKITIDTKEDSHDEIKRAIDLLNNLLGLRSNQPKNIFEDNSPSVNPFGAMFGDDSPKENFSENSSDNSSNALSSMFDDKKDEEKEEEEKRPHIEFY